MYFMLLDKKMQNLTVAKKWLVPALIMNYYSLDSKLKISIKYRVFIKYCFFFQIFKKYSGLWPFSVFPRCQCVYTHQAGITPALQQNWQSSEKSQNFKEKTQYLMNTLYIMPLLDE